MDPEPQKAIDLTEYRDAALRALRNALEICCEMLESPNLASSVKLKWIHGLAQTSGVLCNILKGMGKLNVIKVRELTEQLDRVVKVAAGEETPTTRRLYYYDFDLLEDLQHFLKRALDLAETLAPWAEEKTHA